MELSPSNTPPVTDLELSPASTADERAPEVGVDLLTAQPWVTEPGAAAANLDSSLPGWLCELDVRAAPATPPPPRPTASAQDPFEALLAHEHVTADDLDPAAEPTVRQLSPLFAEEQPWWIAPPAPSPVRPVRRPTVEQPACTPPQWRAARRSAPSPRPAPPPPSPSSLTEVPLPSPRPARYRWAASALAAMLCAAIGVTLLGGNSASATDLVVPPPPAFEAAVPAKVEPEHGGGPALAAPSRVAAPTRDPKRDLIKRTRAAKKWAAESWPEVAPAAVEQPAAQPAASDELKRPEF